MMKPLKAGETILKGKSLAMIAVSIGLLGTAVVYAGNDSGPAPDAYVVSSGKIQEETIGPSADLAVRQQDLQLENKKANRDPDRIAALQKQIDELRAENEDLAYVYDRGSTRGQSMHHNRMIWQDGYGRGCGCR